MSEEIDFDNISTKELIRRLAGRLSEKLGVVDCARCGEPVRADSQRFRVAKIKLRVGPGWEPARYHEVRALVSPNGLFAVHRRCYDPESDLLDTDYVDGTHVPSGLTLRSIVPLHYWDSFPKVLAWVKRLNAEVEGSDRLELLLRQEQLRFVRRGLRIAQARMLQKKEACHE